MVNDNLHKFRIIAMISSLVFSAFVISAIIYSYKTNEWRNLQSEYAGFLENTEDDINFKKGLVEISPFGRKERCISCHIGIENHLAEGIEIPIKAHSGNFIEDHPLDEYGCIVCHGGQGRAVDAHNAHALSKDVHWNYPILKQPYIQSSCGKCHLSLFSPAKEFEGAEVFVEGQLVFNREGCLGCHKARKVGGALGPDLTSQGEKTRHEYDFQYIKGEQSISHWLREHFLDPEMVSPGSKMLAMDLDEDEIDALVTFILGLKKPDVPFMYLSEGVIGEFKGSRNELAGDDAYKMICSACHGRNGEGKDYEAYETGVSSMFNIDFLSMASEDFLLFNIEHGRTTRDMQSWMPRHSGLQEKEVEKLAMHILSMKKKVSEPADRQGGNELFDYYCAICHAEDGSGGIGLNLRNEDFQANADDNFIRNTISLGRTNTAMPSFYYFDKEQLDELLSHIRKWGSYNPPSGFIMEAGSPERGKDRYHYLCSRCHGQFGEGATGPAVLNKSFTKYAEEEFLYMTISNGRKHTPMHGWNSSKEGSANIGKSEIADIISFIKSGGFTDKEYIYAGPTLGDAVKGSVLFEKHCIECHGEEGNGRNAPQLNNQELLNSATNGFLTGTIILGRRGTAMPSWGRKEEHHHVLTNSDIPDIVAFIRSWQQVSIKHRLSP